MECSGISINRDLLLNFRSLIEPKLSELEKQCHKAAGQTFLLTSPSQVANVLYEELKLKKILVYGKVTTGKVALEALSLQHPLP